MIQRYIAMIKDIHGNYQYEDVCLHIDIELFEQNFAKLETENKKLREMARELFDFNYAFIIAEYGDISFEDWLKQKLEKGAPNGR